VQALVQGESLFNDATSLVLFQIAVSFAVGGSASMGAGGVLWHAAAQFVLLAGGGAVAGGLVAATFGTGYVYRSFPVSAVVSET
jgi:monovalent cation/hydrogen antiporter